MHVPSTATNQIMVDSSIRTVAARESANRADVAASSTTPAERSPVASSSLAQPNALSPYDINEITDIFIGVLTPSTTVDGPKQTADAAAAAILQRLTGDPDAVLDLTTSGTAMSAMSRFDLDGDGAVHRAELADAIYTEFSTLDGIRLDMSPAMIADMILGVGDPPAEGIARFDGLLESGVASPTANGSARFDGYVEQSTLAPPAANGSARFDGLVQESAVAGPAANGSARFDGFVQESAVAGPAANGSARFDGFVQESAVAGPAANGSARFDGLVQESAVAGPAANGSARFDGLVQESAVAGPAANGSARFDGLVQESAVAGPAANGSARFDGVIADPTEARTGVPAAAAAAGFQLHAAADRIISELDSRGFSQTPPMNLHSLLDQLNLDLSSARFVLQMMQAKYPNGLGVNMKA